MTTIYNSNLNMENVKICEMHSTFLFVFTFIVLFYI